MLLVYVKFGLLLLLAIYFLLLTNTQVTYEDQFILLSYSLCSALYETWLHSIRFTHSLFLSPSSPLPFSLSYYEYNWKRNKGVSFGSLFQGMPISLQADISISLYKGIIDQVTLCRALPTIGWVLVLILTSRKIIL